MIKHSVKPTRGEILAGGIYLGLNRTVLPLLLQLPLLFFASFNEAVYNFCYFSLNFMATTVIFHKFLLETLKQARQRIGAILFSTLLAYLGSSILGDMVGQLIYLYNPEFYNVNDSNINAMVLQNPQLMFLGTVILAPVSEELLFRGLIFRSLYDRSPAAAHFASIVIFSMIHVSGYVGLYDVGTLMLCFLQYIPISYCMNFAYVRSGSILAPMLLHIANNAMAMSMMR